MAAVGLQVDRLRCTKTFARLRVESDADITYVDLATDARLMPAVHTPDGPVLAESDLAADKTLALTGRAETRDYVDFHALAHRFDLDELCTLAEAKDGGFRAAQAALWSLSRTSPQLPHSNVLADIGILCRCPHVEQSVLVPTGSPSRTGYQLSIPAQHRRTPISVPTSYGTTTAI